MFAKVGRHDRKILALSDVQIDLSQDEVNAENVVVQVGDDAQVGDQVPEEAVAAASQPDHPPPEHPHGGPPGQTGDNPGQGGTPPGQSKPRPDQGLPEQPEPQPKE